MKDATGELSMTAVAVVAIAAVSVVFTTLIWPSLKANWIRGVNCSQVERCDESSCDDGVCTCYYRDADGELQEIQCSNKD